MKFVCSSEGVFVCVYVRYIYRNIYFSLWCNIIIIIIIMSHSIHFIVIGYGFVHDAIYNVYFEIYTLSENEWLQNGNVKASVQ